MMKNILTLCFLMASFFSSAQKCFQPFYNEGLAAYEQLDFEKAINQFNAAKICEDLPPKHDVDEWISKAQNGYINTIKKERTRARSLALTASSILELQKNNDATKAFRYAKYAMELEDSPESRAALYESFYQLESPQRRIFYVRDLKLDIGYNDAIETADFIDQGQSIFVSYKNENKVDLFDIEGEKTGSIPSGIHWMSRQAYSETSNLLLGSKGVGRKDIVQAYFYKNAKLNPTPVYEYESLEQRVTALAISADGEKIAACFTGGFVHILDKNGRFLYAIQESEMTVKYLSFSGDNHLALAFGNLAIVVKLGASNYEKIFQINQQKIFEPMIELSPDNQFLLLSSDYKSILFSVEKDTFLEEKNLFKQRDIGNFSPDSRFVGLGNNFYDIRNQQIVSDFPFPVRNVKIAPDQNYLVTKTTDPTPQVFKFMGNRLVIEYGALGGHTNVILQTNWSRDNIHLLTASLDHSVKIWNHRLNGAAQGYQYGILQGTFVIDGELMIALSQKDKLSFYNEKGEFLRSHTIPVKEILAISEDGRSVFANAEDNSIEIWQLDLENKRLEFKYGIDGISDVKVAAFSNDNKAVFYNNENMSLSLQVWNFKTGKVYYLSGFNEDLTALEWTPDNKKIVGITKFGQISIWDVSQGLDKTKLIKQWKPHPESGCHNFRITPDGQSILTCGWDKKAVFWDFEGQPTMSLEGHVSEINDVDFSPDGQFIATASADKQAKIWTTDGILVVTLPPFSDTVERVKFSQDGKYIVTNYNDQTIKIWPFDPGIIINQLESLNLPDLTEKEKIKFGISTISTPK